MRSNKKTEQHGRRKEQFPWSRQNATHEHPLKLKNKQNTNTLLCIKYMHSAGSMQREVRAKAEREGGSDWQFTTKNRGTKVME